MVLEIILQMTQDYQCQKKLDIYYPILLMWILMVMEMLSQKTQMCLNM